jgi:hypothetical protein
LSPALHNDETKQNNAWDLVEVHLGLTLVEEQKHHVDVQSRAHRARHHKSKDLAIRTSRQLATVSRTAIAD